MHPKIFGVQCADGGGTVVQPGAPQPFAFGQLRIANELRKRGLTVSCRVLN